MPSALPVVCAVLLYLLNVCCLWTPGGKFHVRVGVLAV